MGIQVCNLLLLRENEFFKKITTNFKALNSDTLFTLSQFK